MIDLASLRKLPESWADWKRVSVLPERVIDLENRIAALEAKPRLPICEACGLGYRKLVREQAPTGAFAVFEGSGTRIKIYKCDSPECGFETTVG